MGEGLGSRVKRPPSVFIDPLNRDQVLEGDERTSMHQGTINHGHNHTQIQIFKTHPSFPPFLSFPFIPHPILNLPSPLSLIYKSKPLSLSPSHIPTHTSLPSGIHISALLREK
ncbi:hypothetical protein RIF29_00855 [Crotalaria pallida]|uniref:Uncharacterized protein n=1 Tax=Crotalaria pallida TaxID=3830 RepID=A0AAN9IY44_CROPI